MEKLLQKIVKKFIKTVNYSDVKLKLAKTSDVKDVWDVFKKPATFNIYKIKFKHLTIGSVTTVVLNDKSSRYLNTIDINPAFRSMGIGGYILNHYFSGYYIMADNSRASKLYARIGKEYAKFTRQEFNEFLEITGMHGVYKLDCLFGLRGRKSKDSRFSGFCSPMIKRIKSK